MTEVAVVDYGMGNLHSMAKALERVAPTARVRVSDDPAVIGGADRVVFPGVGAMGACMEAITQRGLAAVLAEVAATRPLLGVCLGMHALMERSEENGGIAGLGLLPGRVTRFPRGDLKVPHMGWNRVEWEFDHPVWCKVDSGSYFYFVHSYFVLPERNGLTAGRTDYGPPFASAVAHGNIVAVQFHPEKSQQAGLALLSGFMEWSPA